MEITRHFTSSAIIVFKGKVLLHLHKKLGIWIPVGGHIDRDELPQDAAIREAEEESGLDIKLYNADKQLKVGNSKQLIRPMHILLEDINQFHQHVDFIYYATSKKDKLCPQNGETSILKWFSHNEIEVLEGAPENVKTHSLGAIKLIDKLN